MQQLPKQGSITLAAKAFVSAAPIVVMALVILLALTVIQYSGEIALPRLLTAGVEVVLNALIAFAAHNYIISNGTRRGLTHPEPGALKVFIMLSALVLIMLQLLTIGGALFGLGLDPSELAAGSDTPFQQQNGLAIAFTVIILLGSMLYVMSAFGTIFPAIVDGGDTSLAAAWNRGTTFAIMVRLVGSALFVMLLTLVISLVVLPFTISAVGDGGGTSVISFLPLLLVTLVLNAYSVCLVASILSKAYLGVYTKA